MMKMKLEPGMVLKYKTVPSEFDYLGGEKNVESELLIIIDIIRYKVPGKDVLCYHVQSCKLHTISSNTLHRYYSPLILSRL